MSNQEIQKLQYRINFLTELRDFYEKTLTEVELDKPYVEPITYNYLLFMLGNIAKQLQAAHNELTLLLPSEEPQCP